MIEHQKEKYGWEFLFIAANIDAQKAAAAVGIDENMSVNYHADSRGTEVVYESVSRAINSVRKCASVSADWKQEIEDDYNSRK